MRIRRQFVHLETTFVANTCETDPIDAREYSSVQILTPGAWTAAAIGFKVSPVLNTTFKPLYSSAGVLAQCASVTVDQAYVLPSGPNAGGFVRLWSQAAGVDTDQTAERKVGVVMKG